MPVPAQYVSNYGFIGIAKETTFGTAVAASTYFPFESEGFETDPGWQAVPTIKGTRAENNVSFGGEIKSIGQLVLPIGPLNGALLLAGALGTDVKTGAGPFVHTMTPNEAGVPSFTVEKNLADPGGAGPKSQQFTGCIIGKYALELLTNAPARATVDFLNQVDAPLATPSTPSYVADTPFSLANYTVTLPGTANPYCIRAKFEVDNTATPVYTFSGQRYSTLNYSGARKVVGEVEVILQSMASQYTDAIAGTYGQLVVNATQGAASLVTTMPKIQWGKPMQALKRGALITQVLPFTAFFIAGQTFDIQCVLTNTFSTQYV